MRCPILIGREEPAAWLAGSVRRLSGPRRGSALVLAGEAGIGKSRLAQHLSAVAGRAGIRVVTGRALPGGIGGILAPVAEVVLEVTRDRSAPAAGDPELAPYRAVLASVVPHWREPGWSAPAEPIVVTAEAVLRVLRWATEGAGVVVILEDLHWADDATLAVARYLADHADEVPVALLATVRTGDGRDDVIALLGAAGAEVSRLGRLTSDEAAAMVAACTGRDAPATGQLAALVHAAEGLPLLVEDLLATGDLGGLPPRFADTVRARLARLDTGQRSVLDAAALLGRRFDGRLLAAATDLPGEAVAGALYRGAAAQLIVPEGGGFAFRHALTRDVILADLTAADRRRLSLAAAGALAGGTDALAGGTGAPAGDDDGRALLIGRLLADGGQRARAAQTLLAAGRGALAAGDFAAAELLLREADQIAGSPDDRQVPEDLQMAVAGQFAQVLLDGGQAGEAARIAARAVRIADGRDLAAATSMRLTLARACVMTGRWDEARAQLSEARAQLTAVRHQAGAGAATAAEIALVEAQVALGDGRAGSRAAAEHLATSAAAVATEAGRPDLACEALETLGACARLRDLDDAAAAFRKALGLAAVGRLRAHRLRILNELGTVEMLRDARGERLEQARAEALAAGAVGLAAGIGANIAALLAMTGRFDEVVAVAGEVERSAQRLGLAPLQAAALLMQGFALAHQGRAREMDRYLSAAEALAPDDPDLRAGAWGIGRGLGCLLAEDRDGARQAFARARREAPDQHARILNPYEGPELLLRAIAGEVSRDEIDTAMGGVVRAARWPELWFGAARAVALGAEGDAAAASAALAAALDAGCRYPVFSALVERLAAEAGLRDRWGEPAALLQSADATFTRLRLGRASAACRALLKVAGHPAPRRRAAEPGLPSFLVTSGVTAREAEVLDLIAERLSNREIADRLFLSPRTVEKHVAALLAKLGATDRAGLARLARGSR